MDLVGEGSDAAEFFYRGAIEDTYRLEKNHFFYRGKPFLFRRQS